MQHNCISRAGPYKGENIVDADGNSVDVKMNTGGFVGGGSVLPTDWKASKADVEQEGGMPLQIPSEEEEEEDAEAEDEDWEYVYEDEEEDGEDHVSAVFESAHHKDYPVGS